MKYAALLVIALSACAAPPPPPVPPPPRPVALDSFQRQLVAARAARRTHQPASDKAGAQLAYDNIVHAACERVAISGPDKYKPRCNALLQRASAATIPAAATGSPNAPQDPFRCDQSSEDPDMLQACND